MTAIPLIGQTVTTARVNLRQGAANRTAPVLRKLEAGVIVRVQALAVGEAVQGNAHWFLTDEQAYIWSGGCGPFEPLPSAGNGVPMVVDISHGDGVSNFALARASGLVGVIHKATTGGTGRDDAYKARRTDAAAAGLLWGAYHWGTARPVSEQLDNFLSWAEPDDNTLVALDYEPTPGNQMTLDVARQFLQGIQDRLGRKAVLYSGSTLKDALGSKKDPFFGAHRLWLAQYGSNPSVQLSWDRFWLWQYTDGISGPDPKTMPGIPGDSAGHLDCDRYVGTEEQLRAEWAS
jgi:hypothetical protein